ncbi:MAG TPA: hypothetical protein VN999_18485, partial [Thermoanaerobaculia bacterium]|nr:hypothetical protein [Thermoanaerobaculia bacterium]
GTRKLYDEIVSEASPFFNFGVERLPLHNFLLDTLNALVVKPMHSLGIAVQDAAGVAQELIVQTGGHPATTQHLLSLVVTDPQVDRERTVSRDDVRRAAGKHEFLGLLRDTLNMNVSPLGRFILAQMTIVGKERVNADFVQGVGTRHAVHFEESQLDVELQDLANSGYLRALDFKRGQSQYELAVPVVQHLFSSDDIADLVHEMLDRKLCTANLQRAGGGHAKTVS